MANAPQTTVVRFGVFELDLAARQLRKNGTRIKLQDQPFRVLQLLLERPGEIVTRDELREKLWSDDTFVEFDHSLNTTIQKIRQALGDSASTPRFVETIPRTGYRFVAPVEPVEDPSPPWARYPRPRHRPVWFALAGLAALGAAVGAWWLGQEPRQVFDPASYRLRRLTYDNGLAYQPALSADGKLVVYASDRAGKGNLDIWLQQAGGGEPIPLTSDSADEFEPSISPDGSQVVFRSTRDHGGIYVVPTLGGAPRLLASPGYRPRFSPDGQRVAYWLGQEHVPGNPSSKVLVVRVEGGEAVEVGSGRSPVWSPDGNRLLYLQTHKFPGIPEWVLSTLDGEEPSPTTAMEVLRESNLAGDLSILLPPVFIPEQWLSDGRVLFSAGSGQAFNIWSIHIAPRTGHVSGPPQRITTGSGEHRFASGANDGRLAFADVRENRDIWVLPTDTNAGKASGEIRRETSNAATDEEPSLSPDGSMLAFRSNRSGAMDVWAKNLTTGQTKPLTATEMDEGTIIVKADGEFVAFTTRVRQTVGAGFLTYAVRTADGDLRKLCENCGVVSDWSRSGKLLIGYIESAATRALGLSGGVTLTDTNTGRSRVLFRQNQPDWRFAPDERWLAFHNSTQSGRGIRQVFIAPLPEEGEIDESDLIPVTDGSDNSFLPGWSPDGNLLYYGSSRDGNTCIFAQRLDQRTKRPAGPVREIYHAHSARISLTGVRNPGRIGLSVAKDKIAFTMAETTGDIWIMEPTDAE